MKFKPVFLPADRDPFVTDAERIGLSQTFLRHYAQCPRSGFLYLLHRGEASTREMVRGTAFHEIAKRATALAITNGEVEIPPEVVKTLAQQVLAELPVVWEDHDIVREMSYRWGAQTTFDPSQVVACETLFALDVEGYSVRCRVDFAEMLEGGAAVLIEDYKTSRAAQPYDEIARKRPDGSMAAKAFQLILYAIELAFGHPVREEDCPHPVEPCPICNGRGVIETPEPFSLAGNAQRFDLAYVFPSIEDRDGMMVRRSMSLTRLELLEYRDSLFALLDRLTGSVETGDWPAVVSDAACSECPASSECPIPAELRDHRGVVNTPAQAAEAFAKLEVEKKEHRARGTELRKFVEAHGPVIFDGKIAEIAMQESERVADKEGLLAAVQRAVDYGEPFERSKFIQRVQSFPLKTRDLTADELAELSTDGKEQVE